MNNDDLSLHIAAAPGHLPASEIEKRSAKQAEQFRHDNTISPLAPQPHEEVEVWATSGSQVALDRAAVWYTTDGSVPTAESSTAIMEFIDVIWEPLAGFLKRWRAILPAQPAGTIVRYKIAGWTAAASNDPDRFASDGQGFWFNHEGEMGITTFAYRVEADGPVHPNWFQDAIVYEIFLDRFHPGTQAPEGADQEKRNGQQSSWEIGTWGGEDLLAKHGGTLRGVLAALPYLANLGVNCLWLSPINISPTYHRYDPMDYFEIDPVLGSNDDLRALTTAAHELGMRVLLDFVPSHCSWKHAAFVAARQDPDAATRSWFTFYKWPDHYRCFIEFDPSLPSINTNSPDARRHIIDSAIHWVRDYGIDGLRIDHAIGHGMDFWTQLRHELTAVKPDVITIAEATDTADNLRRYRGRLHDVLDFPLSRALRLTFGTGHWSVAQFDTFLDHYERYMEDGPGRVSFLDNHDMDRFLFVAGGTVARLKVAALCQFSLQPPPVIYYGTEIGMSQTQDKDAGGFGGDAVVRSNMVWDSAAWNQDLLTFYQQLIRLRQTYPALRYGTRQRLHLDEQKQTYAYRCAAENSSISTAGGIVVVFNLSNEEQVVQLPTADYTVILTTIDSLQVARDGIILPPCSGAWLSTG